MIGGSRRQHRGSTMTLGVIETFHILIVMVVTGPIAFIKFYELYTYCV